jgi:circadian clock protein KaiC
MSLHIAVAAAERGERAAVYTFDEDVSTLLQRAESLNIGLKKWVDQDRVKLHQINPAELTPGAFADMVRHAVRDEGCRVVVMDSLNGYMYAMPEERFLTAHLHELFHYLNQRGVVSVSIVAQHGLVGHHDDSGGSLDVSYISDAIVLVRYFEAAGEVHKAISVMKNRNAPHETTIRELVIGPNGVEVGSPLLNFHGVLTGTPEYHRLAGDSFHEGGE